ncbi:MAG: esterase/lipase family protein [Myxococcota bacterium]
MGRRLPLAAARRIRPVAILVATALAWGPACQTPVGVKERPAWVVERELTANVLVSGVLSQDTRNLLRWASLEGAWQKDPEQTLALIHTAVVEGVLSRDPLGLNALVAAAELAFDIGQRNGDPDYFLQSVIYAWGYLFRAEDMPAIDPVDPRGQLAIGLYNRGLARAFRDASERRLSPRSGRRDLPFGSLEIEVDEASRHWEGRILDRFTLASELEVRGMRNRYRWKGLGAAVAASVVPDPDGPPPEDRLVENLRVSVAAVLVFEDYWETLLTNSMRATLTFRVGLDVETIEIEGITVPLAMEPTATLAYMLAESSPWARELKGFFEGDLSVGENDGIAGLQPFRKGKIPVVLVHGTASGPARWAELLNDMLAEPRIRRNFQFWLFTYNTGNPIAYSGWLLRRSIREAIDAVDPADRDDALDRMVVMGHSQGGLLAKLTAIDSGSRFWDPISDVPIEDMELAPESREILEGSLFVKPVPEVERVVFMATPHRGSYVAAWGISQWVGGLTHAPANLGSAVADLVTQDEVSAAVRRLDRVDGAVANMSPGSRFIQTLAEIPIAPGIKAHSIIAAKGDGPLADASDGVVRYESAHIEGVESEKVIRSGHSVQQNARLSQEVRRILLEHIGIEVNVMGEVELR